MGNFTYCFKRHKYLTFCFSFELARWKSFVHDLMRPKDLRVFTTGESKHGTKMLYLPQSKSKMMALPSSFPEISCRGERIRDYYQKQQGYAACQTAKKVSRLDCRGGCDNGQCCGPLRSKRRKYSFECTDGSSFVEEVEKIVKCGCSHCSF